MLVKIFAQLVLGPIERRQPGLRQLLASAIDVESQHRHGGLERGSLAAVALFSRGLQRVGDLLWVAQFEDTAFQIRIAAFSDILRPFLFKFLLRHERFRRQNPHRRG